jgi:hypothetical protein
MTKRLTDKEIEQAMDWQDDPNGDLLKEQKEHRRHDQKEDLSKPRERNRRVGTRPMLE